MPRKGPAPKRPIDVDPVYGSQVVTQLVSKVLKDGKKQVLAVGADAKLMLSNMFADVRMLCHDTGLMNPVAKLVWKICRISGAPSRFRAQPQRAHLAPAA